MHRKITMTLKVIVMPAFPNNIPPTAGPKTAPDCQAVLDQVIEL